ncbi:hypothetical protein PR048_015353 [Dryococelus australis]|uniref:HTH CENPB-type domain-containing protein n=1 Tax=Dryococelus australis TaxID=614101 RepID=A0ABQ9HGZ7_9NEOP|nr:hypothetical protein PR048_015353 [Dryococelus australis]
MARKKTSKSYCLLLKKGRVFLGDDIEDQLAAYCKKTCRRYHGLRRRDVWVLAYQLAVKNNLTHPFTAEKGMAGKKWLENFLHRHPELAMRTPRAVSLARVKNFTREKVDMFFQLLKSELQLINHDPSRNWYDNGSWHMFQNYQHQGKERR